jgi:hypothetical protein
MRSTQSDEHGHGVDDVRNSDIYSTAVALQHSQTARTVEVVSRRPGTTILGEIPAMLTHEFREAGASARLTSNPTDADLVVLVGQGPELSDLELFRSRTGVRATVAFWEIDPLPPPGLSKSTSDRQLRAAEVRERVVSGRLGPVVSRLPRHLKRLAHRSVAGHGALGRARHSTTRKGAEASAFRRLRWIRETVAAGHVQHVLCTNQVGVDVLAEHQIEATRMPVGYQSQMGHDESKDRDLDVVFLGHLASIPARAARLRELEVGLGRRGIALTTATDTHGSARASLLNRAKIVLDLPTITWHPALTRFVLAAACGALVVAETPVPHTYPSTYPFEAGRHFVVVPPADVPSVIEHYTESDADRRAIVESATELVRTQVTMRAVADHLLGLPFRPIARAAAVDFNDSRPA